MIRELVLDTETTGFSPDNGDKIVEIGIVELNNHVPTGQHFHKYLNPERSVPESAFKVHGLDYEFLKDKPLFKDIAKEMLDFINTDSLIIHNANFDISFLNYELLHIGQMQINFDQVIDTLEMARQKFPGSPASLDALCRRFSINNSERELHGALLDSYILAKVYLELIGGNQPILELDKGKEAELEVSNNSHGKIKKEDFRSNKLPSRLTAKEIHNHKAFISRINGLKNWSLYD